jgi:hypothetical protein
VGCVVPKSEDVRGWLAESFISDESRVKGWVRGVRGCYAGRAGIGCNLNVDGFAGPVRSSLREYGLVESVVVSKVVVTTTKKLFELAY